MTSLAYRQAIVRWWEGRQKWRAGEIYALGGRFTPPYAIDDGYSADARSVCTRNALSILGRARSEIPNVEVKIYSPSTTGNYVLVDEESLRGR